MTNKKKNKIGFIGQGWIGKNYADNFEERGYEVVRYDISEKYIYNKSKIKTCNIVFVAVPTPTTPEGYDDSILINALKATAKGQIIVIKSTLKLGTTDKLQNIYKDRFILHSPEFLTEKTAKYDAANPARNIIGYTTKSKNKAGKVMNILPVAPYEAIVPCREAEFVKYMGNCWFYFKVLAMNLFYDVAKHNKLDFDTMKEMLSADKRIGRTHLDVIHQGGRGAGGDCFIKDFATMREMYHDIDDAEIDGMDLLSFAEEYNKMLLRKSGKDSKLAKGVWGKL